MSTFFFKPKDMNKYKIKKSQTNEQKNSKLFAKWHLQV